MKINTFSYLKQIVENHTFQKRNKKIVRKIVTSGTGAVILEYFPSSCQKWTFSTLVRKADIFQGK